MPLWKIAVFVIGWPLMAYTAKQPHTPGQFMAIGVLTGFVVLMSEWIDRRRP